MCSRVIKAGDGAEGTGRKGSQEGWSGAVTHRQEGREPAASVKGERRRGERPREQLGGAPQWGLPSARTTSCTSGVSQSPNRRPLEGVQVLRPPYKGSGVAFPPVIFQRCPSELVTNKHMFQGFDCTSVFSTGKGTLGLSLSSRRPGWPKFTRAKVPPASCAEKGKETRWSYHLKAHCFL